MQAVYLRSAVQTAVRERQRVVPSRRISCWRRDGPLQLCDMDDLMTISGPRSGAADLAQMLDVVRALSVRARED
jgi:hypothetical protein